ncbi:2-keto-4-pentenoate hydratase [Ancylobacter oerskovii]|uniref:2-keto-4-pentenoate hydratase n=1 Tax=Ancylobacter oerskovii TaxID=459519 RepID=A0ABW4YSL5_9HYPH|nr:fumarylacetoacetate hydrolase family protein [Ancylobacter oerskovii]MBS7544679.1 fumarylacetoacetate hydrolase family protein [Ancylobacter oerskovii]
MPSTAEEFVGARREARPLADFPGTLPAGLDEAYAVQEEVLRLTPRRLAGWKVAGIPPAFRARYDAPRLVGPVFADVVQDVADGGRVDVFVYEGGFAAVEAEFVVRLTADAPEGPVAAAEIPAFATLHVGSEIASSPLASINDLGPGAVIADHGNNAGAIVGPAIAPAAFGDWEALVSRTLIGGELAGQGTAARVAGGPFESVAFLIAQLAGRGRRLRAGDIVLTGMTTGVHDVRIGEEARIEFPGVGGFGLRVKARTAERSAAA